MIKSKKYLFRLGLFLLIFALVLAACSNEPTPTPIPPTEAAPEPTAETETAVEEPTAEPTGDTSVASLVDTPWVLVVYGEAGNGTVVQEGTVITAVFNSDGTLSGSGGCNSYSGSYEAADDGSLTVGPLISTQAFCEDSGDQEQAYLTALQAAQSFLINQEGRLEITYPSGSDAFSNALVYAVGETPLENTGWVLLSYGPEGAASAVIPGTAVTANFYPDSEGTMTGTLTGSATCNSYHTTYTADDGSLTVGPVAGTRMLCPAAQDQEDAYMAAISTAESYEIFGTTLTITYDGGTLTYTSANFPLDNVLWALLSIDGQPVPPELTMTALFLPGDEANSGTVGGSGACNNFSTSYSTDGDQLSISPMASTLAFCPEGADEEQAYFSALSTAQSYNVLANQLAIETDEGTLLFIASRAPLEGTLWDLISVGPIGDPQDPLEDSNFTAVFERLSTAPSGIMSGETGCNSYNATYAASLDEIRINLPSKTLADCGDAFLEAEQQYFLALNSATTYRILGNALQILYDDGNQALTFTAAQPPVDEALDLTPLNDTFWYLISLNGQDLAPGTEVTAQFHVNEDGVTGIVSGSGGCNDYNAPIGENFVIGNIVTTQKACPVPPGVEEQEQAYFASLSTAYDYSFAGDQLLISNANGVLTYSSYRPNNAIDQTLQLQNKTWTLLSYGPAAPVSGAEPTAFFNTDGTITGRAGCNDYNGVYTTQAGNNLAISNISTTLAACATDALSKQESDFIIYLQSAVRYLVTDTQLQIQTVDGDIMNFSSLPNQTVPAPPTAVINGPTIGDVGQTLTFDASASTPGSNPIVRYDWDLGDGTLATGTAVSHAYNAAGTYTVRVTAVDAAGQTGTSTTSVVINAVAQTPPTAVISGPTTSSVGDPALFDASASTAGSSSIQSYTFNFGNGIIAGPAAEPVGSTVYKQAGSYQVTVTVTDQNGLSDSASMQIAVSAGLQGTAWVLANTTGGVSIDINFGSATLTGFAGCNSYNAAYTLGANGSISIGSITTTQMLCSEEIMQQETQYLQILQVTDNYVISGSQLSLNGTGGSLIYSALIATPY